MTRIIMNSLLVIGIAVLGFGLVSWAMDLMGLTFIGLIMVGGLIIIVAGSLFDIWRRADLSTAMRIVWSAAIMFFPLLGTLVYVFARPPSEQVTYRGDRPA